MIPLDEAGSIQPGDDPNEIVRGFPRNDDGRPIVTHPTTGKPVPYWGGSDWPLDGPYRGDPIHGQRGTWLHELTEQIDTGQLNMLLESQAADLGIPADVAEHVATDWERFKADHDIVIYAVEAPSVNDTFEIASLVDRIATVGGHGAAIDIKSSANPKRVGYAAQIMYYVGSQRYDGDARHPWPVEVTHGHIAHFPLNAAIKAAAAGEPLPAWQLIEVNLETATAWATQLHNLRRAKPSTAFGDPIATPEGSAFPSVESPAGADGLPAAAPAVTRNTDRFGRPVLPKPDEGDDADSVAVAALKARYEALEADGRAWLGAIAKAATAHGGSISLAPSQPQSQRRWRCMDALVVLCEHGFADDDGLRGILRPILGDVADDARFNCGQLVGCLTPDEADTFADLANTVATGSVALAITNDGRHHWQFVQGWVA